MIQQLDRKALLNGFGSALVLIMLIYAGSNKLKHFDPALIAYTSASVFALFAIVYRYSVWLQKPPTRLYWRRGWQLFFHPARLPHNVIMLAKLIVKSVILQTFIDKRSHLRWAAHFLLSWGCIVAAMVTFPLVFGWIHFESDPKDASAYQAMVFGFPAGTFGSASPVGWVTFHILDFCAVAVILGMALAFKRRMSDKGAISLQSFSMDFLPLIMLFSVSITGLMLTVSATWLRGHSYSFIALIHAFSVIVTLLYLPFGKFFHIFQRPANLGVQYYKEEGVASEQAHCKRCDQAYASLLHVQDLKKVLDELGLDQHYEDGTHYQEICPSCRRKLVALNQKSAIGGTGFL